MSLVLALDTATETCAVALGRWPSPDEEGAPEIRAEENLHAPRQALARTLPTVRELLDSQGLEARDVDVVVVGRGPGSYTGVRIGMAMAKGFARGISAPLHGVSTLDAVAWGLAGHEGLVGVVGDAMRGEVYPALFRCADGRAERLEQDRVADPLEVARAWARATSGGLLLAGDGLFKHAAAFLEAIEGAHLAEEALWTPRGSAVIRAGWAVREPAADAQAVLPVYTRLSDAEHAEGTAPGSVPPSGVAGPEPERPVDA